MKPEIANKKVQSGDHLTYAALRKEKTLRVKSNLTFDTDPLKRGRKRKETTPNFREPIFSNEDALREFIKGIYKACKYTEIEKSTGMIGNNKEHVEVKMISEQIEERTSELTVVVTIFDFSEFVSDFPFNEEDVSMPDPILGLNGEYYRLLDKHITDSIEEVWNHHAFSMRLDDYDEENDIAVFSSTYRTDFYN